MGLSIVKKLLGRSERASLPVPKRQSVAKRQKAQKVDLLDVLRGRVYVINIFQRRPYTMVQIEVPHDGQVFKTFGFSKVSHPDRWDPELGAWWAITNALIYLIQHYHLRPRAHV